MSDIYKEFGVDVLRDCCSENEGPTAAEMKMAQEIKRLRARVDALRWPLAVFIHAHASGSNVPPHIEAAARTALEAKP
jgi:hypothetical protein